LRSAAIKSLLVINSVFILIWKIDPMKVSASKKRRQHQEKLMVVVSHIIDSISRSADQVPLYVVY
jgi:hypothetical protein